MGFYGNLYDYIIHVALIANFLWKSTLQSLQTQITHKICSSNTTARMQNTYFSEHIGSLLEVMAPALLGASKKVFYQPYSYVITPARRKRHAIISSITH